MIRSLTLALLLVAPVAAQSFDDDVAPLLVRRCLDCHNDNLSKGKLDLSREKAARAGGKTGPAVVPGKLKDSLLWQRVEEILVDLDEVVRRVEVVGPLGLPEAGMRRRQHARQLREQVQERRLGSVSRRSVQHNGGRPAATADHL